MYSQALQCEGDPVVRGAITLNLGKGVGGGGQEQGEDRVRGAVVPEIARRGGGRTCGYHINSTRMPCPVFYEPICVLGDSEMASVSLSQSGQTEEKLLHCRLFPAQLTLLPGYAHRSCTIAAGTAGGRCSLGSNMQFESGALTPTSSVLDLSPWFSSVWCGTCLVLFWTEVGGGDRVNGKLIRKPVQAGKGNCIWCGNFEAPAEDLREEGR